MAAKKRRLWLRLLLWALAALLLLQVWFFAQVLIWRQFAPWQTSFMRQQLAVLRERQPDAELDWRWVPYARIAPALKRAVVAAEDDRFMQHSGFDWAGLRHALERNHKQGKWVAGGSTISQQLAKNLFLSPSRNVLRKAQEAAITVMIETTWPKQRILEVYLNVVEWGNGVFGAEAAAQHYHGVSAARLSNAQAAQLAVRLPNPRHFERNFGAAQVSKARRIQQRMQRSQIP